MQRGVQYSNNRTIIEQKQAVHLKHTPTSCRLGSPLITDLCGWGGGTTTKQINELRIYSTGNKALHTNEMKKMSHQGEIKFIQITSNSLLTIVKRRELQWYGNVSRSSGLAKTILQGTVKGGKDKVDRGRGGKTTSGNEQAWSSPSPRGRWRTGKKWRKLVAKSSVVPQRPSRLRDR